MKKALLIFFFFIFFVQYSLFFVLHDYAFGGVGIVAAFIVALCLREDFQSSLIWSFFCGLVVDYFSTTPIGTYAIIFVFVAGVVELYKTKLTQSKHKKLITFTSVFVILIFVDVLSVAILKTGILWGEPNNLFLLENIDVFKYLFLKLIFAVLGVLISILVEKTFDVFDIYSRDIKI